MSTTKNNCATFIIPNDSWGFSKTIKDILDLGLRCNNGSFEEPFALFFHSKEVNKSKIWGFTSGIINTIFMTFKVISEFDDLTRLKISKKKAYCVTIYRENSNFCPVFELEEKIFLELLSLLSDIQWSTW